MADDFRPFVIDVKRRWTLWILPIIATIYFLAVIVLHLLNYKIQGVTTEQLALGGVGLFILVILIEIPFFFRRSAPKPRREQTRAATSSAPERGPVDDEYLTTTESQQGLQVLEYSAPAKSRNQNTVYTKTYVVVSGAHVMRVETAVADAADI